MNSSLICQFPQTKQTIPNTLCNVEILRTRPPPKFLRVLNVDDNESRGIANAKMISRFGHTVDLAQDGISALRMAAANQPDVVLLNIDLRNLDDCDIARRLRFDYPERPPLFIGLAAHAHPFVRQQCVVAGMDMVLEMPLTAEAIETVLLFECAKVSVDTNSRPLVYSQQHVGVFLPRPLPRPIALSPRKRISLSQQELHLSTRNPGLPQWHRTIPQHTKESHRLRFSIKSRMGKSMPR